MAKYVVVLNMPGYLPESDPAVFDTVSAARAYMRSEVLFYLDSGDSSDSPRFDVFTPLRAITASALGVYGEITYGEFSDGYRLSVSLAEDGESAS